MNNKYDFNEQEANEVLNVAYPVFAALDLALSDLIESMEQLTLDVTKIESIRQILENLEYLDEFEKAKNDWSEVTETFYMTVMNVQVEDELGNPYAAFMYYFNVDELFVLFDDFLMKSAKLTKVNQVTIMSIEEFRAEITTKAKTMAFDVQKLIDNDETLNVFLRQWQKIVDDDDITAVENEVFEFIMAFEEYNGASELANERFWEDKAVKLIYELLNRVLAIISLVNFLGEFKHDDELVEDEM